MMREYVFEFLVKNPTSHVTSMVRNRNKSDYLKDPPPIWNLVWFWMVWYMDIRGTNGYCLDVVRWNISSFWVNKRQSYGQFKDILYNMVWLGIVWIGFEWYGAWVFSRCSSMQNLTPSLKIKRVMDDVRYLVWYG